MRSIVNIGLIQMKCTADQQTNFHRAMSKIREAAAHGAHIICLQELFSTLYFCQTQDTDNFALAEPVPGLSTRALATLAGDLGVVIIASIFEKRAEGIYHNTVAVLDSDGTYLGKYRKMHIPDDPQFYEKFYFTPGDLGFKVFPTRFGRLGTLICWDQWYPEAARLTALQGADILFYPTAIGWLTAEKEQYGEQQHSSWETIQRAHAIANGCYVVAVNRTGHESSAEGGIEFWGRSFVADPSGTVLARAATRHEETLVVACDLSRIGPTRVTWPFLRDRRIDAYSDISRRFIDEDER